MLYGERYSSLRFLRSALHTSRTSVARESRFFFFFFFSSLSERATLTSFHVIDFDEFERRRKRKIDQRLIRTRSPSRLAIPRHERARIVAESPGAVALSLVHAYVSCECDAFRDASHFGNLEREIFPRARYEMYGEVSASRTRDAKENRVLEFFFFSPFSRRNFIPSVAKSIFRDERCGIIVKAR